MATRPWQHVLEPLSGYLLLAKKLYENGKDFSEGWNFGPSDNKDKSVSWIVNKLFELWGAEKNWTHDRNFNPHEATNLILDSSKAFNKLKWNPRWGINIALNRTVNWYKKSGKNNILNLCSDDIKAYEES